MTPIRQPAPGPTAPTGVLRRWTRLRARLAVLLCSLLWAAFWLAAPASAEDPSPGIVVVDGDTLEVDGQVLRLYGIDAPELGQTCLDKSKRWRCGLQAALELRGLLRIWGNVTCSPIHSDAEGSRAICHNPQYDDPAEVLLARGLAVALPDSIPAYKRAEIQAKNAKLGIWRGEFVEPSQWRQGKRLAVTDDSPAEVCDVKGIVTAKGNKVYYVPTDADYDAISVTPERGERMFCSDDEAELAGWRRYPRN
jgi:endonuclease YncB( thermonuclease family)